MKFDYMKYYLSANSNLSIYEEFFFFKAGILFIQTDIVLLDLIIKHEKIL